MFSVMVSPVLFAYVAPVTALTLAVGIGLLVTIGIFAFLYAKNRPPKPIEKVTVVKGKSAGQGATVRGRLRIGRDAENDLTIEDEEISRFHCEIRMDTGVPIVIDLKSANGTCVNGEEVHSRRLKPGDEIRVGTHLLRCS